jgi:hypothetical protein
VITSYQILGDVCPDHHHLIHHCGYQIMDNHDGTWSLQPPGEQRSTDAA